MMLEVIQIGNNSDSFSSNYGDNSDGSSVDSVDETLDEVGSRTQQGRDRSHISGGGVGTHGASGTGRDSDNGRSRGPGKAVKPAYRWEEVGPGE